MRVAAFVVAALAVAALASAPAAASSGRGDCRSIPCPPFPPFIAVDLGEAEDQPLQLDAADLPVEVDGTVTWRFDVDRYGLVVWEPRVQLRFTGTPAWLSATVEPASYDVEMSPDHVRFNASDPADPEVHYVHRTSVTVRLEATGTPTPPDDGGNWTLGLTAESSESGTFSSAYGFHGFVIEPADPAERPGAASAALPGFQAVAAVAAAGIAVALGRVGGSGG